LILGTCLGFVVPESDAVHNGHRHTDHRGAGHPDQRDRPDQDRQRSAALVHSDVLLALRQRHLVHSERNVPPARPQHIN
jgi:hypothetical protein